MRGLALVILLSLAAGAAAQMRTIPGDAKHGKVRHLEEMTLEIDGNPQRLSPGAQIRDANNMVVLPAALSERADAKYLLDASGQVHRVWILSAREIAALPPLPFPK
jgi:hypothetical protein